MARMVRFEDPYGGRVWIDPRRVVAVVPMRLPHGARLFRTAAAGPMTVIRTTRGGYTVMGSPDLVAAQLAPRPRREPDPRLEAARQLALVRVERQALEEIAVRWPAADAAVIEADRVRLDAAERALLASGAGR